MVRTESTAKSSLVRLNSLNNTITVNVLSTAEACVFQPAYLAIAKAGLLHLHDKLGYELTQKHGSGREG